MVWQFHTIKADVSQIGAWQTDLEAYLSTACESGNETRVTCGSEVVKELH